MEIPNSIFQNIGGVDFPLQENTHMQNPESNAKALLYLTLTVSTIVITGLVVWNTGLNIEIEEEVQSARDAVEQLTEEVRQVREELKRTVDLLEQNPPQPSRVSPVP